MREALLVAAAALAGNALVAGHPQCSSDSPPFPNPTPDTLSFCDEYVTDPNGTCCTAIDDANINAKVTAANLSPGCMEIYKQEQCSQCSPYQKHLTLRESLGGEPLLKKAFCAQYIVACGEELALPADFCSMRTRSVDPLYSVPFAGEPENVPVDLPRALPAPAAALESEPYVGMYENPANGLWWLVGQKGEIVEVQSDGELVTVIDLGKLVWHPPALGEMGLLGLAFSPNYITNGYFYVHYTTSLTGNVGGLKTVISRFTVDPNIGATLASEDPIYTFTQDEPNHQGGWLGFSWDDRKNPKRDFHSLYISVGDGGSSDDEYCNSQNVNSPKGKMLRIDVPSGPATKGYQNNSENPFFAGLFDKDVRNHLYAWGLRNPWRCSFDSLTDNLWCGDVGQDRAELVHLVQAGGNYGWGHFEGDISNAAEHKEFRGCTNEGPGFADRVSPIYQYCHYADDEGCPTQDIAGSSITGGYIYRGDKYKKSLGGDYIFADFESGLVAGLKWSGTEWEEYIILENIPDVAHIAEDSDGELYLLSYKNDVYDFECPLAVCAEGGAGGTPAFIPGIVEAEAIGAAYQDLDQANGGAPDISPLGTAVATVNTGEWIEYDIEIKGGQGEVPVAYMLAGDPPAGPVTADISLVLDGEGPDRCDVPAADMLGRLNLVNGFTTNSWVEFDPFVGLDVDLTGLSGPHTLTLCFNEVSFLMIDSFTLGVPFETQEVPGDLMLANYAADSFVTTAVADGEQLAGLNAGEWTGYNLYMDPTAAKEYVPEYSLGGAGAAVASAAAPIELFMVANSKAVGAARCNVPAAQRMGVLTLPNENSPAPLGEPLSKYEGTPFDATGLVEGNIIEMSVCFLSVTPGVVFDTVTFNGAAPPGSFVPEPVVPPVLGAPGQESPGNKRDEAVIGEDGSVDMGDDVIGSGNEGGNDDTPNLKGSSSDKGGISTTVAAAIGGTAGAVALLALVVFLLKKKKAAAKESQPAAAGNPSRPASRPATPKAQETPGANSVAMEDLPSPGSIISVSPTAPGPGGQSWNAA